MVDHHSLCYRYSQAGSRQYLPTYPTQLDDYNFLYVQYPPPFRMIPPSRSPNRTHHLRPYPDAQSHCHRRLSPKCELGRAIYRQLHSSHLERSDERACVYPRIPIRARQNGQSVCAVQISTGGRSLRAGAFLADFLPGPIFLRCECQEPATQPAAAARSFRPRVGAHYRSPYNRSQRWSILLRKPCTVCSTGRGRGDPHPADVSVREV